MSWVLVHTEENVLDVRKSEQHTVDSGQCLMLGRVHW